MFAYCRNNSVCRKDIHGTEDQIAYSNDEILSDDDINDPAKSGGGSSDPYQDSLDRNGPSSGTTSLPQQGTVPGNGVAPPVNAGKQGKHVPGHKNYDPSKSSWPVGQDGVLETQEAWMNGVKDMRKPYQNVRIGISSCGTIVRVHMDNKGTIHGYPLYQDKPWIK